MYRVLPVVYTGVTVLLSWPIILSETRGKEFGPNVETTSGARKFIGSNMKNTSWFIIADALFVSLGYYSHVQVYSLKVLEKNAYLMSSKRKSNNW